MPALVKSFLFCLLTIDIVSGETGQRAVRLVRNGVHSQSWNSGIVQIYYGYSWGNICDDAYLASEEAEVICHQLAYTGVSTYSTTSLDTTYGTDPSLTAVEDVSCSSSTYLSLSQCTLSGRYSSYCLYNSRDLVVTCYASRIWDNPYAGQIRLTGGNYSNQGLLEVYCNGQWGTVCDDGFGTTDARVACKQLGYNNYYNYDHLNINGAHLNTIWLTYVSCSYYGICLVNDCKSCPLSSVTSCSHSEDMTLDCGYSSSYSKSTVRLNECEVKETGGRALRLIRNKVHSPNWNSGIVQIYHDNSWGNICEDSYFGADEADVICHQLAYSGASSYSTTTATTIFGVDLNSTAVEDVSCTYSSYLSLSQCSLSSQTSLYCSSDSYDLVVTCYTTRIWDNPYYGQIRLTGGNYSNQGVLEVYCNGQWGTVCDNGFGTTDARVACRQLGYSNYLDYDHLLINGSNLKSIWLTYVSCYSSDKCLVDDCNSCPSSAITSCSHSEDVTLDCGYSSSVSKPTIRIDDCKPPETGERAVRLIRNSVYSSVWSSGIVQIYNDKSWGNICEDSSFGNEEADVICHQLTYSGASSYSTTTATSTFGVDPSSTAVEDVSCSYSTYLSLSQCSLSSQYSTYCSTNTRDLIVSCYASRIWDNPYAGQIRLTGGNYSNQGVLEVYCNGQWGTVCDNGFGTTDARVACKQLGYSNYLDYDHLPINGSYLNTIWLTYVSCSYYDKCLVNECNSCPLSSVTSCSHSEDVTLDCGYSSSYSRSTVTLSECKPAETGNRALRLIRNKVHSPIWNSGIVQIYHDKSWGNICEDSHFGAKEADVICHQLTYSGASSYSTTTATTLFGVDLNSTAVENVYCSYSSYLSISQCSLSSQFSSICSSDSYDLVITCYTTKIWDNPYSGQIRLTGGNYSNQGVLEVYCNGQWGTVCDNGFGTTDARVACKQLGYSNYLDYDHLSINGSSLNRIWLTYVSCSSYDKCLVNECNSCPLSSVTSCSHSEDMTLDCGYSSSYSRSTVTLNECKPAETGNRALRLIRNKVHSPIWNSGIVQIYHDKSWGNICEDSHFGAKEADVICHQLTYSGASSYSTTTATTLFGVDLNSTAVENVYCSYSSYLSISQCSLSSQFSSICSSDSYDLVITCYTTKIWDNPYSGQIRLTGGNYSNQGVLEVYCNGQWGTVCDNGFGTTDARVACKQLGYSNYLDYDHLSINGSSLNRIWLTYVSCSSSYKCLVNECNSCPLSSVTSCSHSEDMTLDCGYSSSYSSSTVTLNECKPSETGSRALRLIRNEVHSSIWSSGIVQIYHDKSWGNICEDSNFGAKEANVICHQLTYSGASSYSTTSSTTIFGVDQNSTAVEDVSCTYNNYLSISQCSLSSQYSSFCSSNSYDLVVTCYATRIWDNPYSGQIRLTGGNYSNQGLLEVYCNGQWGTVCDNGFGTTDARVACRQLGYSNYLDYDHLPINESSFKSIWLTYVSCYSYDQCLVDDCNSCPSSAVSSCSHSEDVTLDCGYSSSSSSRSTVRVSSCNETETGERAVRLFQNGVPSQSLSSGIVQIYHEKSWGNICEDGSFATDEADVICHQLAYTGASSYSTTAATSIFGVDISSTAVEDVTCSYSTYLSLSQCSLSSQYSTYCSTNTRDLIVSCYTTRIWDSPYTGQIRLTGGTYSNQGLLEVYCNGQWGTVCDDSFGTTDARVACKQLGYSNYKSYDHLPITGNASKNIWLTYVSCRSTSTCLQDCKSCPSSAVTSCSHSEDVTLDCGYSSSSTRSSIRLGTCENRNSDHDSSAAVGAGVGGSIGGICFICIGLVVCGVLYSFSKSSRRTPVYTAGTALARTHTINSVSNSTIRTPVEQHASSNLQTVGFQYVSPTLNPQYVTPTLHTQYEAPLTNPPPYSLHDSTEKSFTEQPPPSYNELFQS